MIISRTPYRISFFGGGTDYHTWYQENGGALLSTTINRYCYLNCRFLPPFFKEKTRVIWSKIEAVMENHDIEHPSVRAVLEHLDVNSGVEVHYTGDLPARSGIGSSSTFTVGMLNAIYGLKGLMSNKKLLAREAIHVEQNILKENVGVQDQIAAAYGGFNHITLHRNGDFDVRPVIIPPERLESLQSHFLLFFTGVSRSASSIAKEKIKAIPDKKKELAAIQSMVPQAIEILNSNTDIREFGKLLHESWLLKKSLASSISPEFVDEIYDRALKAGAIGGKLLGAGGGGFILFFAEPEKHQAILEALGDMLWVPFSFENSGSQIIYLDTDNYPKTSLSRRDFFHLQNGNRETKNSATPYADNILEFATVRNRKLMTGGNGI